MPANLTPEYHAAEERFRHAQSSEEKMEALEAMLSSIPKHKGTEKMQADIKRRIAQLKKEKMSSKGKKIHTDPYLIRSEGAGQVVLIGPPNSGKSSMLVELTHARPDVAPFPFTTHNPTVGMLPFEDIQIQLVDTASMNKDFQEPWVFRVIRNADIVGLVLDLRGEIAPIQLGTILRILKDQNIHLEYHSYRGPFVDGKFFRRSVILANKLEGEDAELNLEFLRQEAEAEFPIVPFSLQNRSNLEEVGRLLFTSLNKIRIYAKPPGKPPEMEKPFILDKGGTLEELARQVHQDFVRNLTYARIWGPSAIHEGQMVHRDHILLDGDIVELHMK
ncbi:MAG TPA: TGS domain-containing protein [Thermoanaerobaculia bacterium]|nr:TGS domain-containing protein [Thermoanaerobaculia bacterium]HUM28782.1 TGS domain-containing protein [Thermoanaerobaculia bacterium]HXK67968.1 TGS domain-containing protein [Thermoanaerobaculia bacterium]